MNKKIFHYCFVILCFNFLMMGVDAYKCTYNFNVSGWFGGTETVEGYFEVDTQNNKIIPEDNFFGDFDLSVLIADPMYDDAYDETKLISDLNGGCPSQIWACKASQVVFEGSGDNYILFLLNATLMSKIEYGNKGAKVYPGTAGLILVISGDDMCSAGILNESESTGDKVEVEFECDPYNKLYEVLEKKYCDHTSKDCNPSQINEYNEAKSSIQEYCRSKLKYGIVLDDCVGACLKLSEDISKIEGIEFSEGQCGFSEKLINWIANIIKWGKYLVPVVVIVMGIIDFIQAIAADKDDGMKKAQGRFIKRLIAAALIFILPFIIEFVLNKMGFDANGCGIIDL